MGCGCGSLRRGFCKRCRFARTEPVRRTKHLLRVRPKWGCRRTLTSSDRWPRRLSKKVGERWDARVAQALQPSPFLLPSRLFARASGTADGNPTCSCAFPPSGSARRRGDSSRCRRPRPTLVVALVLLARHSGSRRRIVTISRGGRRHGGRGHLIAGRLRQGKTPRRADERVGSCFHGCTSKRLSSAI